MDIDGQALTYLAGAKWVTYVGLIGLTGALVVRRLLVPAVAVYEEAAVLERALRNVVTYSACLVALSAAARLYAQTYSVFGLDEPITLELIRVVGLDSRWGERWQPQAGLSLLTLAASISSWWLPSVGWRLVAGSTVLLWLVLPLTGHAMAFSTSVPWVVQSAHGLAVGLWVGSLFSIVAVSTSLIAMHDGPNRVADLIRRFSPLAVGAVSVIILTGLVTTWFYFDTVSQLRETLYGKTLLVKIGFVLVTAAFGAYNWRCLSPKLGSRGGTNRLRKSVRLEVTAALVVLLATAVLVHLAMPHELG